jgi:hypothetical protein
MAKSNLTDRIAIRTTPKLLIAIEEHRERLAKRNPGILYNVTDSVRSLITIGARQAREQESVSR